MLAFVSHVIVMPFAWIAFLLLKYELWIVHIFGQIPFAIVQFPSLPIWLLGLIYACFGVIVVRFNMGEARKVLNHNVYEEKIKKF